MKLLGQTQDKKQLTKQKQANIKQQKQQFFAHKNFIIFFFFYAAKCFLKKIEIVLSLS